MVESPVNTVGMGTLKEALFREIFAPRSRVLLAPDKLSPLKGVVPPTAPLKVSVPVPILRLSVCAPSTVLLQVMFPAPLVVNVGLAASWTGPVKLILLPDPTVMLPPREIKELGAV
jgi:hypothetical protein